METKGKEEIVFSDRSLSERLGMVLSGMLCFGSLAWAIDLYRSIGLSFMNEQFFAAMLSIAIPAVFLLYRVNNGKKGEPAPLYDWIISGISFVTGVYVAYNYPDILDRFFEAPIDAVICSTIFILTIAEGLRRTAGRTLFFFLVFFVLFGFLSYLLPFSFRGEELSYQRYTTFLGLDSNGLMGFAMQVSTTMVVAFLLFGFVLERAGGAAFFTDFSKALVGQRRGGAAKIAVVASSLFGSISGSAVSNVVSTGVVTIPLMERSGYRKEDAAGIEAVASTGGQIMPPMMGIAAFLIAEILQRPYSEIVIAALIPALLYYWAVFVHVDLLAARHNIKPLSSKEVPRLRPIVKKGWLFFIPFVVIIVGLFNLHLQPETAAFYATLSIVPIGIFLGYHWDKLHLRDFVPIMMRTGHASLEILMISAAAGIIIGVLNISGLGFGLTLELVSLLEGFVIILLLVVAVLSIILGMGMPTIGVYLLLATMLAPSIIEVGIPDLSAHLFVFYFGLMSLITPPVAIAAFTAAAVAKANSFQTAWASVRAGWVAYLIPFLVVASPVMIMQGDWVHIILSFLTALIGVWFTTVAIVGQWRSKMPMALRLVFTLTGLLLIIPTDIKDLSIYTNVTGFILALILITTGAFGLQRKHTGDPLPNV